MNAKNAKKIVRDPIMATKAFTDRSSYGMACVQCGNALIAPELSECVGERQVRNFWHCSNCGCRSEETAYFCAELGPTRVHRREASAAVAA